jgi:pimeloyl-ACP methyl ester carboxylesterase
MRHHDITVDGIRIHYAEAGEGPALVLLHGLSATHINWEHTIAAFAGRWRVIAPDLPGHGRSAKPDAPYTIDFYAGVIRSLGHALGIDEAVVAGNSLGGQIALEIALEYPTWARALVLAAPAGGFAPGMAAVGRALEALARPRVLRTALPLALGRSFYDRSLAGYEERRRVLAERIADADFPDFARAVARTLAAVLGAGHQPLERVTQPTLVVWGRNDRMIPVSSSRRLARAIPHARLIVLERCGHVAMLEQPAQFNHALEDFLHSVEAAPRPLARGAAEKRRRA